MTAPLQQGYAVLPNAYGYPAAPYAQQPYVSSPYLPQVDTSMQQTMQSMVAQLGVLIQALQGVVANLAAGLPGNYGIPGAVSGYQQLSAPQAYPSPVSGGGAYPQQSYAQPSYPQPNYPSSSYPSFPQQSPSSAPAQSSCSPGCACCSSGSTAPQSPDLPPIPSAPAPTPAPDAGRAPTPGPVPTPPPSDSNPTPPPPPTQAPPTPAPAPAPGPGPRPTRPLGELTPNAWRDPNRLSEAEKQAVCGPVAAAAFARFMGKDMSIDEAADIARPTGWDTNGMKGADHEMRLLDAMGVKAHKEDKVDWEHVKREIQAGRPVIIDTPQHYYVVEGYNAQTGEFNFGQSAAIKKSHGGKTWLKPEELSVSGGARSGIYLG
jgi:hypothetical protein